MRAPARRDGEAIRAIYRLRPAATRLSPPGMDTEEKISAFVWIQVAMAMLVQVLLVVFVVGFIVGHYFIGSDDVVEVAPNGEEISFGTPPPMESWSAPNGEQYNRRVANSEIDSENVNELGVAWTLPITAEPGPEGSSFTSTPVVDEKGVVYFQDAEANVFAVNIDTGQEIWKHEFNAPSAGPNGVAFSHEVVYGCASSFCFALDPKTGEEIWKSKDLLSAGGGAATSAPEVKNGMVFVSAASESGGEAFALDAASGEVLWQASGSQESPEGAAAAGAAAIGPEGTVFIGTGGSTSALDPSRGDALWSAPGMPAASPAYSEESGQPIVLAVGTSGSVDALDPKSGKEIWTTPLEGGAVAANMAVDAGVAYAVGGSDESGAIAALEVKTGNVLWEEELPAAPLGAATVSNDIVFTTLADGTVLGASRRSGQVIWEEQLPGPSLSPLVVEEDTLIAVNSVASGSEKPQIVAFRLGATEEAKEKEAEEKAEEGEEAGAEEGAEKGAEPAPEGEQGEAEEGGAEGEEGAGAEGGAAGEGAAEEGGGGEEALATEGKTIFETNCATCHTLADAGATGTVGPDLDQLKPEKPLVETQVTNGGGGMPAFKGILSEEEIEAVSEYVAKVAGGGG